MAFAPSSVYNNVGDGSIIGQFYEKDAGNYFDFSANNDGVYEEYPHKVWVTTPRSGIDHGFRYAVVKKTVCYIVVDEDDNGPVVEQWFLKKHTVYGE